MSYQYSKRDFNQLKRAQSEKHIMQQYGISFCTIENEEYPMAISSLKGMPSVFYYKGDIKIVNQHKNVAVIGSREASQSGLKWTRETGGIVA
ncbi:MAG: hypothetical protein HDR22_02850, partial [Lachnospiraceae bacterium]|nr:hypothetical protein [Lachnospiraceae bacterium]